MPSRSIRLAVWVCSATLVAAACAWATMSWYRHRGDANASGPPDQNTPAADSAAKPGIMDEEQRAELWEIEHLGLVLGKHGFRAVSDAISRGDEAALTRLLATEFAGQAPSSEADESFHTDLAEVRRVRPGSQPALTLDRAGFVARLFVFRRPYTRPPSVQISLMQLAPGQRGPLSGPWQGSCQLRMTGEMGPGRPGEVLALLAFKISEISESSLRQGSWLHSATLLQSLVTRAPHFLMREATAERGIDPRLFHDNWNQSPDNRRPNTGGVYACDFNRDGILDLLITDVNRYVLYQGLPDGKFVDVTAKMGLRPRPGEEMGDLLAAFVDLDGDGWEDLILGGKVYRNEEGRQFKDYTARTNLRLRTDAVGITTADYDRDGRMDLYVFYSGKTKASSWLDGSSGDDHGNELWRNKGDWQFENVTAQSGTSGGRRSTFSAVWLDANNDGWPDLYVINEFGSGVLLVNKGDGTFREVLMMNSPNDFGSMGVTCGDIDNDGHIDIYTANMYSKAGSRIINNLRPGTYSDRIMNIMRHFVTGSQLWRNRGNLNFEPQGKDLGIAAVGWAYGAALVDLDNDGWLDLFATCGFMSQSRSDPDG
jgi:hypothetical protein